MHRVTKIVLWALTISLLALVNSVIVAPLAQASDTTYKFRFVESGTALSATPVTLYRESSGSMTLTTDANGEVTTALGEGYNSIHLSVVNDADLTMIFGGYIIKKGSYISEFNDFFGRTIKAYDGKFTIEVERPNVKGNIGAVYSNGKSYVTGIWDVTAGSWINAPRWGITSQGNFYSKLAIGKYLVSVVHTYGQASFTVECNVVNTSTLTICDKEVPPSNLNFNILNGNGELLKNGIYAWLIKSDKVAPRNSWLDPDVNGDFVSFLDDGDYLLDVISNNSDRDGQASRFTFSVAKGSLSNVTNAQGESVTAIAGKFPLKLTLPNFQAQLKANGSNATGGYAYAYQGKFWQNSPVNSSGVAKFSLPNGKNTIQINPLGTETPTVVSANFEVTVAGGVVTSVTDGQGNLLSPQDSKYPLNFRSPNLLGQISVGGVGVQGWINGLWNTVNNDWAKYDLSKIDDKGNYAILVAAGNYDILGAPNGRPGGVKNCNVTSGVTTTCNLAFPAENFKFDVLASDSSVVKADLNVRITPLTITRDDFRTYTLPYYTEYGVSSDISGRHSVSLLDGTYRLNIGTSNPIKYGTSRELMITVETGTVKSIIDSNTKASVSATDGIFGLSLNTPNFKGVLKANGAVASSNWVYGYPFSGDWRWYDMATNSLGQYAFTLPDGEFYFQFNPRGTEDPPVVRNGYYIKVESATVTSVINANTKSAVTATGGEYEVTLATANLVGEYKINGASAFDSSFSIYGMVNTDTKIQVPFDYYNYSGNKYALKGPEGTYQTIFYRYGSGFLIKNCEISNSILKTCDANFPTPNLKFKIQSYSGEDLLSDVYANAYVSLEAKSGGWGSWLASGVGGIYEATFSGPTTLGYSINVNSNVSPVTRGTSNNYDITLNSDGSIASVVDRKTGVAATQSNGVFALKLAAPSIAGTVVGPDGATPIANARVEVSGPEWNSYGTDKSGGYAFRLPDGTYSVTAFPSWNDSSKVESAPQQVVVTSGVGNNNLQLQLRLPNVVGTVSGPKGVSPYNYIQVMKQDSNGNWDYIGRGRSADSSGKFVFYLEAGTYRFAANGDEEKAGGGSVVSDTCQVTNVSETKTCNIVLSSYNMQMKLLGSGGSSYTQASAYFYFEGNKEDLSSRPLKTWDSAGANSRGELRFALTQGTWRGRVDIWGQGLEGPLGLIAEVDSNGQVTALKSEGGTAFSKDSSGFFVVQLPTSNLTGTISFENKRVDHGSYVQVMREVDGYFEYVNSNWSNAGKFAFVAQPGVYEIWVMPYPNTPYSAGMPVQTKSTCTVPESGSVVCDISLRKGNFHGKITRPSGEVDFNSYVSIYEIVDSSEKGSYEKYNNVTSLYSGFFSTYLANGTYNLWVGPDWNSSGKYTAKLYKVIVSGNAISSVTDVASGSSLTAVDGRYSFALGAPNVTGRVLKPVGDETIPHVLILPIDSSGNELWQYSTYTNGKGGFALNLPNGNFKLVARTWGDGYAYTSSAQTDISVTSGATTNIDIRVRAPNLTGRVVSPSNSSIGLSYVWINGFVDGQHFWAHTNGDGYFGAYIENSGSVDCPNNCRITLNFWNNPEYAAKSYPINTIGNLGNLTPGVVNAKIQVKIPTNGSSDLVSKWSWVSAQEISDTGTVLADFGASTNELGIAGLSLTVGKKYKIVAYPSWEYYSRYSYKSVEIASFNATTNALTTITFDSPNITLVVKDRLGKGNSWGWYEVYQGTGASKTFYLDSYLNDQGRGALSLPDGSYTIIFYPGKASGVQLETTFTVTSGAPSGTGFGATGVGQFTLAGGNVSGKIYAADSSTALASIPITAVRDDDNSVTVSTVSQIDGYYELNLNRNYAWTIKAINPTTMFKGSSSVAAGATANEVASNKHVYLTTSVP